MNGLFENNEFYRLLTRPAPGVRHTNSDLTRILIYNMIITL